MDNGKLSSRDLLLGAVLGGVVACASVSLLKSYRSRGHKNPLQSKYHEYKDKIEDFISTLKENIEDQVDEKTTDWCKKAKSALEGFKNEMESLTDEEHKKLWVGFLIGGVLGGLLGAGTSRLCSGKSYEHNGCDFVRNMGQKASGYKHVIENILNMVESEPEPVTRKATGTQSIHEIVDFLSSGAQLWNSFRRRR